MSLPAEIPAPSKHTYVPDEFNNGATCRQCGYDFAFGGLHPEPDPSSDPEPDNSRFRSGDVVRSPSSGGLWRARYDRYTHSLEWVELLPLGYVAPTPPTDAELLHRSTP